jgi:predicted double-glycine peptidase
VLLQARSRRTGRRSRTRERGSALPEFHIFFLVCLVLAPTIYGYLKTVALERPSVLELGWTGVVAQTAPNTCGPAVLATLLAWQGKTVSEMVVASRANLQEEGITLAEFSRLGAELGLSGRWLRVAGMGGLGELPAPFVAHLRDAVGHYAIFLQDLGTFVHLVDPARGQLLVPKSRFLSDWTRRAFVFDAAPTD